MRPGDLPHHDLHLMHISIPVYRQHSFPDLLTIHGDLHHSLADMIWIAHMDIVDRTTVLPRDAKPIPLTGYAGVYRKPGVIGPDAEDILGGRLVGPRGSPREPAIARQAELGMLIPQDVLAVDVWLALILIDDIVLGGGMIWL